jgi:ADP-ribosyl-[dinitrogen reductase] hydrolase
MIFGQLAGAFYGEQGIPEEWVSKLHQTHDLGRVADSLLSTRPD